jgi:N-acetylmuramoyl-L-alanine amidase
MKMENEDDLKQEAESEATPILKNSEVPALTLEMGFLSNTTDREYITSEEGQNQIAQTILNFVSDLK